MIPTVKKIDSDLIAVILTIIIIVGISEFVKLSKIVEPFCCVKITSFAILSRKKREGDDTRGLP